MRTHTNDVLPSLLNAIPLHLSNPSATTRTALVSGSRRYTWFGMRGNGRKWFKNPYLRAAPVEHPRTQNTRATYVTSVKKILLVPGRIFASLSELNCLPKKLSKSTVVLCGGDGLTRATEGGRGPRPELMSIRSPLNGPVPPLVIWIVSGRSSWEIDRQSIMHCFPAPWHPSIRHCNPPS